jgi:hypothetical protein
MGNVSSLIFGSIATPKNQLLSVFVKVNQIGKKFKSFIHMAFSNGQNNLSYCWYFLNFLIIITYFFVFQAFRPNLCTTDSYTKSDGLCACGFFLEIGLTFQIAADTCHSYGARLPEIKRS